MKILCIPFSASEGNDHLRQSALRWMIAGCADAASPDTERAARKAGTSWIIVERGVAMPSLAKCAPGEQVYVLCHGGTEYGRVHAEQEGGASITVGELARRLDEMGLGTYQKTIKLWMCNYVPNLSERTAKELLLALRPRHPVLDVLFYRGNVTGVAQGVVPQPSRRYALVPIGQPQTLENGDVVQDVHMVRASAMRFSAAEELSEAD
jgi:hypothetical protein